LFAAVLIIPRVCVAVVLLGSDRLKNLSQIPDLANYAAALLIIGFLLAVSALSYIGANLPITGANKDHGTFLRRCLLPLLASAVSLTTAWAWFRNAREPVPPLSTFLIFGLSFQPFFFLRFLML